MSVTSVTHVFQLALDAVGTRTNISSPTELSREAEVCARWYPIVRDNIFRAAFWPSTKRYARLAVLAERDYTEDWTDAAPAPDWRFAYGVPSDFISARHLVSFARFDLVWYSNERVALQTDQENAILHYSFRNENPAAWDSGLQLAVITGLAAYIALQLTGKPSRTKFLIDQANAIIQDARVAAANELHNALESVPPEMLARGASWTTPTPRYIAPYGPLLSSTGLSFPAVSV